MKKGMKNDRKFDLKTEAGNFNFNELIVIILDHEMKYI